MRRTKAKHLKRLDRQATVVNNNTYKDDLKVQELNPKIRRPQQHTSIHNDLKVVEVKRVKEPSSAAPQAFIPKDEPADLELKSLSLLDKDNAGDRESFLLKEAFSRHFLLGNISLNAIDSILKEMDYFCLEPNKTLFDQGDTGMHLFILTKGILEVKVNGATSNLIHEGSAFGEIALIYSCKRTAKI